MEFLFVGLFLFQTEYLIWLAAADLRCDLQRVASLAHLVNVFEFIDDLADDRLGGLVAPGLSARVGLLRSGKPGGRDIDSDFHRCKQCLYYHLALKEESTALSVLTVCRG